ncbi:SDR family oxidoreductase [Actinoplanes derwentensis]|uniref:SDR family oxidoreductase n=1 Tax=Actinoplanes derwentensis TaxID=113562 RepID=UPI000B896A3B|nr:SDR family oxidoreductase [Actinoplanes derwentensis]
MWSPRCAPKATAPAAKSPTSPTKPPWVQAGGIGRTGTSAEIAAVVAFLTGPESFYITGTDVLIDGGQAAGLRRHREH